MRIGIVCTPVVKSFALPGGQPNSKPTYDFCGDLLLDRDHVLCHSLILISPQLQAGCNIDKFCTDLQPAIPLQNPTGQNGGSAKSSADCDRIRGSPLEAEHG